MHTITQRGTANINGINNVLGGATYFWRVKMMKIIILMKITIMCVDSIQEKVIHSVEKLIKIQLYMFFDAA